MKEKEANAMGLTLSEGQCNACRKNGFEVFVKDVRYVTPQDYGIFDAVTSVGGFEHFCSLEEYKEGKQEMVYTNFFKTVYDLLPPGKRFYMQTMVFGKNMIDWKAMDLHANKNSDAYILAVSDKILSGLMASLWIRNGHQNCRPIFQDDQHQQREAGLYRNHYSMEKKANKI